MGPPKGLIPSRKSDLTEQPAHGTELKRAWKWATAQNIELRVYLQADYH